MKCGFAVKHYGSKVLRLCIRIVDVRVECEDTAASERRRRAIYLFVFSLGDFDIVRV
jgi:hypothetical protein